HEPSFLFQQADFDLNPGLTQALESLTAHGGIGIFHAGHYPPNAASDHGVHARTGSAAMAAGFEVDIERGALGFLCCLLQGKHLGVLYTIVSMKSRANDLATPPYDHRPDVRIRRGHAYALPRQVEGAAQVNFVLFAVGHFQNSLEAGKGVGSFLVVLYGITRSGG